MNDVLRRCLDDVEERIDEAVEADLLARWHAFLDGEITEGVFITSSREPKASKVEWPKVKVSEFINDSDAMLLDQFTQVSRQLGGDAGLLNVRCNYSTGLMACLFGCELYMMDDDLATLPTAISLGSTEKVAEVVRNGMPDLDTHLGGRVFETAERFKEVFAEYPKIARNVTLHHPDTQSPIDVAELIWGSDMFYGVYDEPQLFRELLELLTETHIAFLTRWYETVPAEHRNVHKCAALDGRAYMSSDSLMNLSPETYVEFIRQTDQRVLDAFGGGVIHFCGRGDHFIEPMSELRGLCGIQLSQPEYNDMECIYRNTVDKGIRIYQLDYETAINAGRPMRGMVHAFAPADA